MAACVHLPYQRRLFPTAETVSRLAKPPEFALGERSVQVWAATIRVAHTFEAVKQATVVAVICQGDIDPVIRCLVYCRLYHEPRTYMNLRGRVGVLPLLHRATFMS